MGIQNVPPPQVGPVREMGYSSGIPRVEAEGNGMSSDLRIKLGLKSDPIEYRYSYAWLFRLMAEEGVHHLQLGTFFELYHLEDKYFTGLRALAEDHDVAVSSVFTAHRELGGFFRCDAAWERVARRNYERLIEVGALLGARHAGSNPGAALRDCPEQKESGLACYVWHMKELMAFAHERGVDCLTIEPMSCLAEPPTLPEEIRSLADTLLTHHRANPKTARVGYCADTSHGYVNEDERVVHTNLELFQAALPYLEEIHVRNTDALFSEAFGFSDSERCDGVVDLRQVRELLDAHRDVLPRKKIIAYIEFGGPKLGRDYSDSKLEELLRGSIRHCRDALRTE